MATETAKRDPNYVTTIMGLDMSTGLLPTNIYVDESTHRMLVNAVISGGISGGKSNNAVVPGATNLGVLPAVATAATPTYTEGNQVAISTDLAGNLRVTGSLSLAGTTDNSAFTAGTSTGTPAMGFYHATIDTVTDGRAATIAITSKRAMHTALHTVAGVALLAQQTMANSIPVVIASDQGSVPVAATLQAGSALVGKVGLDQTTPGTTNAVSIAQAGANTILTGNGITGTGSLRVTIASDNTAFSVNSTLQTQTDTVMIGGVNVKEINAVAPLMGNGITGTGSLRVTIASDNTAFSVNATLSAETTKVIGTVRNADGAGNLWTSNSNTFTAKFAQDVNILGTLGTAFTTAGKVDVKAADGDVFVRQATAANLNATVVGQATGAAVPAAAFYNGVQAQTALPAAATAGNLTGLISDKYGRAVTLNNAFRDIVGSQRTTIAASTTETTIVTAAASIFNDIFLLTVKNTSATALRVDIRDTTAGTIIDDIYVPAGDTRGWSLTTPLPQSAVNTNWTAQCSASVTDVRLTVWFVKNK